MSVDPPHLDCPKDYTLYVQSNGVHTDLILPIRCLNEKDQEELAIEEGIEYVAFGWGDQGFYLDTPTWAELKLSTALTAAFLKSPTLMHITRYKAKSTDWKSVQICQQQLDALDKHIKTTFERDSNQKFIEIEGAGYTPFDRFYRANGTYSCIRTCNIWVNEALKKAQIKTAVWSPFDYGILRHLD